MTRRFREDQVHRWPAGAPDSRGGEFAEQPELTGWLGAVDARLPAAAVDPAPRAAPLTGDAAMRAVPVQALVEAAGMDMDTWRTTGFEGLDRNDKAAVTAVTGYLRRPWFANRRLRAPSEPLHDQTLQELQSGVVNTDAAAKAAAKADRQIAALDRVMQPISDDIIVYRGVRLEAIGDTWTDAGFVSTTARRDVAEHSFSGRGSALLRIRVPRGTPALGLEGLGEAEVLLARGLPFRQVADHGVLDNGARFLDVEVV